MHQLAPIGADVLNRRMDTVADQLLTPAEVAALLRVSPWTLANWRRKARMAGPPYLEVEGLIRYRREDVVGWLDRAESQASA